MTNPNDKLWENIYRLDEENNIYYRPNFSGIEYSDGDDAENKIKNILDAAHDISVFSEELVKECDDWATLYHLSPIRANILRPFSDGLTGADVLEIGAGCGAITRFLGESGAEVLALEGTSRRASIARKRTRDLSNVTVVAEHFTDLVTTKRFDLITLIGVLEYASMYSDAEDVAIEMLERAKSLLKPKGKLVIAIENKLGLKYFAGAPEDHVGSVMFGIENRYSKRGVRTFGLQELQRKVVTSGMVLSNVLLPFPDYKFPTSILNATAFTNSSFDASVLAQQAARKDPQLRFPLLFSLEAAWREVAINGLAPDLSNSFLLVAGSEETSEPGSKTLAWHFSNGRKRKFFKITRFIEAIDNSVESIVETPDAEEESEGDRFTYLNPQANFYYQGKLLSTEFSDVFIQDGWEISQLVPCFIKFADALCSIADVPRGHRGVDFQVNGAFIDAVPHNIIEMPDGNFQFFDREWQAKGNIKFSYLIFRVIVNLAGSLSVVGTPSDPSISTWADVLEAILYRCMNMSFSECREAFIDDELALNEFAFLTASRRDVVARIDEALPKRNHALISASTIPTHNVSHADAIAVLRSEIASSELARQIAESAALVSEQARLRAEDAARVSEEARQRAEKAAEVSEHARLAAEAAARASEEARIQAQHLKL